jgi:hypothetical protein
LRQTARRSANPSGTTAAPCEPARRHNFLPPTTPQDRKPQSDNNRWHRDQGHRLALEGQPCVGCPFLISGARPCFARRRVTLLHRRRLDFGSPCFGFGLFCARCSRRCRHSLEGLALTWASSSSNANASRPSGQWSDDDYDVLSEGEVVGRIMKVTAAPENVPWMCLWAAS